MIIDSLKQLIKIQIAVKHGNDKFKRSSEVPKY